MFLKRVEIFGFKSFADRSVIEFGDNISALVGPNGCGKSNVVDAVKWVLGEQSTKTLRAERMEDVIFNGTENRKKLNVAEIALVLSNEKEILPLDLPEVSIKRRLYRSGESGYSINNAPVKLKDLRELFFDTGIGKTAYSIMEQGKIDQILSNKPEDRRGIFEEAAGITKYKVKGAEAERKLERTEENMTQVENIRTEVKRSFDSLKGQAEKTNNYRQYKDQLFELELDSNLLKLKDLMEKQDKKQSQLDKRTEDREKLRKSITELNNTMESSLDSVNSMEHRLNEAHRKVYGIELEKGNKENQIVLLKEQHREIERQITSNKSREEAIQQKITVVANQISTKRKNLEEIETRLKEIQENIKEFMQSITYTENRIGENETDTANREKAIGELDREQLEKQDELRAITDDIVTQLDERLKESGYSHGRRKEAEEAINQLLKSLEISLGGKINRMRDISLFKEMDRGNLGEIWNSGINALEAARAGIEQLDESFTRFKQNIPTFLDEFLAPEGIITKKREIDEKIEEIRRLIKNHRDSIAENREENKKLGAKISEYRKTLEELRLNEVQNKTQYNNVKESIESLTDEIKEQEQQLEENRKEIAAGKRRLQNIEEQITAFSREKEELAVEEKKLREELSKLEKNISKKNEELVKEEKILKSKMAETEKLQTEIEKLQIDLSSLTTEIRNIQENFRENHSRELLEFESRMFEIQDSLSDLRSKLTRIKEDIRNLGHINLMAPEEFAEVKDRYEFLTKQLEDLRKAREDLRRITKEIRVESTELFLDTYEKIKKNFHAMFRRLFGGGRAEVRLLDEEDVLSSGVDILAQPPGKKLENITLLSGGERSLTAVALLFAVYMVRPSPFCILDEIDAALDEENVGRFVNLLIEFSTNSQFVIITHNKRTIAAARTLLGVTMSEPGVSKVIAVRVDEEREKIVNEVV